MTERPKSINDMSIVIIVISIFVILGNGLTIVVNEFLSLFDSNSQTDSPFNFFSLILGNYSFYCGILVFMGLLFLIGAIYLRKLKELGRNLIIFGSVVLLVISWTVTSSLIFTVSSSNGPIFIVVGTLFCVLIWSVPFVLLIRFLTRPKTRILFKQSTHS